jgi:hypothetical protein
VEQLRCGPTEVLTFVEDFQSHVGLLYVYSAEYKNLNKKGDAINLIAKKKIYELSITEVEKKIANLKGQFWREHKKVVASKKEWIFTEETNLVSICSHTVFIAAHCFLCYF